MKFKKCYIQGRVLGFIGHSGGLHYNIFEVDELSVGDIVKYPTTECRMDSTTGNVFVLSMDDYGSSALILADPRPVYEEVELWNYTSELGWITGHFNC